MSLKALMADVEAARDNNRELGVQIEGKINHLLTHMADVMQHMEEAKAAIAAEIGERDRDLVRLIEGAA